MTLPKKLIVALFSVLLVFAGCSSQKQEVTDADLYVSEEGAFKVYFESEPELDQQIVSDATLGDIPLYMFIDTITSTELFIVSYADYPQEFTDGADKDAMLEGAANGALEGFGITFPEVSEKVALDGYNGFHFRGNSSEGFYADYYNYLVGNRLYQLLLMKESSYPSEENVQKYIKSFQLLK
ncbi:hypothetical protein HY604_02790 [Candidatus Peregrinibacteria bacterium]|nr:hypothetical protein [Candidatus Peregrinibacteria bacterium]